MNPRPTLSVAVVMEREARPNRWEDWRFRIVDVVPHEAAFGAAPRRLREEGRVTRWLHPGFSLSLYADEGEGYYLNLSSGNPVWFVMWRIDADDASRAWPETVSLSYNEAGRWLDAQEHSGENIGTTDGVAFFIELKEPGPPRNSPPKALGPRS